MTPTIQALLDATRTSAKDPAAYSAVKHLNNEGLIYGLLTPEQQAAYDELRAALMSSATQQKAFQAIAKAMTLK